MEYNADTVHILLGSIGYMFFVKQFQDAYISKPISTLKLPVTINDIADFSSTLDYIHVWRNHHEQLVDIVLPAVTKTRSKQFMEQLIFTQSESSSNAYDPNVSPNVFFTSSRKRQASDIEEWDEEE